MTATEQRACHSQSPRGRDRPRDAGPRRGSPRVGQGAGSRDCGQELLLWSLWEGTRKARSSDLGLASLNDFTTL